MERYWFPTPRPEASDRDDKLLDLLGQSIALQLRSDVPVGALLSGGLDSGLMVALAASRSARPLKTFTVRFEDGLDETPLAREVAERYATDHVEIDIATGEIDRHLPRLAWFMEEPLGDASVLPNFLIESALAKEVRVALNGTGGDELFGGYPRYFQRRDEAIYAALPDVLRSGIIEPAVGCFNASMAWKLARAGKFARERGRYLHEHSAWFPKPVRAALGMRASSSRSIQEIAFDTYMSRQPSDVDAAVLYADLAGYLPEDLLLLLDRSSMAASVEGRVPYLDHRFVEAALAVPAERRTPGRQQKGLQRALARTLLPPAIVDAPKRGFASPVSAWMRGPFGVQAIGLLKGKRALERGWWTHDGVASLTKDMDRNAHRLFALVVLEATIRLLIEAPVGDAAPRATFSDLVAA